MRYLKLFIALIKISFSRILIYRGNFASHAASSVGWGVFSVISIMLLTSKTPVVFGWSRNELILLTVLMNVIFGIYRSFIDANFWRFSTLIHYGDLDIILLKPIDTQFQMSLWIFDLSSLLRFLFATIFAIYLIFIFHIPVSFLSVLFFFVLSVASIILLYSLTYIFLTLTIWYTRLSNLIDLINNVTNASRYPKEMFEHLTTFVFFILLPIVIIISTPVKALFQKANIADSFLLLLFALIFFIISRIFWKFALRFYSSASG